MISRPVSRCGVLLLTILVAWSPASPAQTPEASGTWRFLPQRDAFRSDAYFDFRSLNEKVAGQSGFVRLAPDGESFVLGDGTPARFWGVTTYVQRDRSLEDLAHHARFLAKRGVNMVRLHGHLDPKDKNARLTDVDEKAIDEAWKLVAAMKKEGIYVTISPYWSASVKHVPAQWGLEGWPENEAPFGLLFFNPKLQEGYKAWLKALLARPNPYTGIPLAKDPALAIIQLQNEDSLLFWTAQSIKGKQAELLGRQFGDWLKAKYGSLAAAFKAGETKRSGRSAGREGVVGLLLVWEWTQARAGGRKRRLDDQLQFYAETMYRFNREIERYLRDELGCKQLVNAGNWRTADAAKLDDAERWSYTANEVMAVNRYYSPVHIGPDRGWRIDPGDSFEDVSVLTSAARAAAEPQAGRRAPDDGHREPLGAAARLSVGGTVPGGGLPIADRRGCLLLVLDRRSRVVEPGPRSVGLGFESQVGDRQPDGPGPVSGGGAFCSARAISRKASRSSRSIAPWARSGSGVPPVLAEDPGYDPNRDSGRHGPPLECACGTPIRSRFWSGR